MTYDIELVPVHKREDAWLAMGRLGPDLPKHLPHFLVGARLVTTGRYVGYACATRFSYHDADDRVCAGAEVVRVYTTPNDRNQNIGRDMLARLLKGAANEGCTEARVSLTLSPATTDWCVQAVTHLARQGFAPYDVEPIHRGLATILFKKALHA